MRHVLVVLMGLSLFGIGVGTMAGCDREVSKHETVETKRDGTQVKKSEETHEKPDGTIVHEKEKSVDHPGNN